MMFKKTAVWIAISCILFGTTVSAQQAEQPQDTQQEQQAFNMVLMEEFNTYNSGVPFGWSVEEVSIKPAQIKSQQCARLISCDARADASMQKVFDAPLEGKVVMEAKVYPSNVVSTRLLFAVEDATGVELQTLKFNNNGFVTVLPGDKKVMMYEPERWYHVQVLLDTDTKTMDLYIDGKQMLDKHPIATPELSDVSQINFKQWDRNNMNICLDDIYVYQYDRVLSTEELQERIRVGFDDISDCWAKSQIEYFANLKLLKNTEDGKFRPDDPLTNQAMAEFICGIIPCPTRGYFNTFTDVKSTDSYAAGLQGLIDVGIMPTSEKFEPAASVTLQEAVTPLIEIYKYVKRELPGAENLKSADLQAKGKWSRNLFGQAEAIHLFDGVKDITYGSLDEDMIVTRAQYIAMFKNLYTAINA